MLCEWAQRSSVTKTLNWVWTPPEVHCAAWMRHVLTAFDFSEGTTCHDIHVTICWCKTSSWMAASLLQTVSAS